ncbi:MAG: amino acid transporter, partial [Planctomycetota bacterium]
VGVIDSGAFKGEQAVDELVKQVSGALDSYLRLARDLGMPATSRFAIGTDAVEAAEKLCLAVAREFPDCTFFAGKLVFPQDRWYHAILHNNTAEAIQTRLYRAGRTVVVLPARVD